MLAREDVGRRQQRGLAAGLHRVRHRQQRDHGLAAADIALQQAQHACRLGHVGDDLGESLLLGLGQGVRQLADDPLADRSIAFVGAPGLALVARAYDRQRQLVAQQLVIGQPHPRRR